MTKLMLTGPSPDPMSQPANTAPIIVPRKACGVSRLVPVTTDGQWVAVPTPIRARKMMSHTGRCACIAKNSAITSMATPTISVRLGPNRSTAHPVGLRKMVSRA